MIFWMALAFVLGVLNLLGSPWKDHDPIMQVNGGIFLLLGLGLLLQWRYKVCEEHMKVCEPPMKKAENKNHMPKSRT